MIQKQITHQNQGDSDATVAESEPELPQSRDVQRAWRQSMAHILVIALGAAIGANLRYGISLWAAQQFGSTFPTGTFLINVIGSIAIGIVMSLITTRLTTPESTRLFLVTGLLGGFTTFSSFSYEAYTLAVAGEWTLAAIYVGGSMLCGLAGVVLGVSLVQLLPA